MRRAPTIRAIPRATPRKLVSTGGAAPKNPHTLALRWTGFSNYELVYGGHILFCSMPITIAAASFRRSASRRPTSKRLM